MKTIEVVTFIRYQFGKKDTDVIEHYSDTYTDESYNEALETLKTAHFTIAELSKTGLFEKDSAVEIYTELQLHEEDGEVDVLEQYSIVYDESSQKWN